MCRPTLAATLLCGLITAASGEELKYNLIDRNQLASWVAQAETKNTDRLRRLQELFQMAGCSPDRQPVRAAKLPNLICTIPGPDNAIIVIGAHYDKVSAGQGIIDNWTGTTLLAALYQALKPTPEIKRKHKILFVAFTEEEKGLIGSKHFVSRIPKTDRTHYQAMINIDSVGLGPPKVWATRSDPKLIELLGPITQATQIAVAGTSLDQIGLSDSFPFSEKQIPTLDFHSITQKTWGLLHTSDDQPRALKLDDYWNTYRLIAAYLAYLDQRLPVPAPTR